MQEWTLLQDATVGTEAVQRLFSGPGAHKQFRVQVDEVIDTLNPRTLEPEAGLPACPVTNKQTMRN